MLAGDFGVLGQKGLTHLSCAMLSSVSYPYAAARNRRSALERRIEALVSDRPRTIRELATFSSAPEHSVRRAARAMAADGRLVRMPTNQLPRGRGTTGARYRLPSDLSDVPLAF